MTIYLRNSQYSPGEATEARGILTGSLNNWTIIDAGEKTGQMITTRTATDVLFNSAVLGGEVIAQTNLFTEKGIIWHTESEPTLDNNLGKKSVGDGIGSFSSNVKGLEKNTTYFVRAYAMNNEEIIYGENVMFKTINIKPIHLSGSYTVKDKYYDGSLNAQIDENNLIIEGTLEEDSVSIDSVNLIFEDAGIGSGKTIKIDGLKLTGKNLDNYSISFSQLKTTTASIIPKKLKLKGTFTVHDKVYDRTNDAKISENNLSLEGIIAGEEVMLGKVAVTFEYVNAWLRGSVFINSVELTGADAGNYTISYANLPTATASILPKELTIHGSFKASDKQYDGTKVVQIQENNLTIEGAFKGEKVSLKDMIFGFENKNAGAEIIVNIKSAKLTGSHSRNYSISDTPLPSTTASITPKELTITGSLTLSDNQYDGTTAAILKENNLVLEGIIDNDEVLIDNIIVEYTDALVRKGKRAYIQSVKLTGADAANYSVSNAKLPSAVGQTP